MIESSEEKFDEAPSKPLAWFFIVMILLNPFLAPLLALLLKPNTNGVMINYRENNVP